MKSIFLIRGIAFLSIMIVSCSKKFIDLPPISSVSVDVVYKTDKDFLDGLTATYNTLQQQYQNFYIFGDINAKTIQPAFSTWMQWPYDSVAVLFQSFQDRIKPFFIVNIFCPVYCCKCIFF